MTYLSYSEKLQNPAWQKRRLSILNRDNFTCQLCGDQETTLHIHHFCYSADRDPCAVSDSDLVTYCKHCHAVVEYFKGDNFLPVFGVKKTISNSGHTTMQVHVYIDLANGPGIALGYYSRNKYVHLITMQKSTIETMYNTVCSQNKSVANAQ